LYNHPKQSAVSWLIILAAAISGIGQTAAGVCWAGALITGVCCGLLIWLCQIYKWNLPGKPIWIKLFLLLWLGVKMLYILSQAESCWQPDDSKKFVPIVVVILASAAAGKGIKSVLNLSTVLAFVCIIGMTVISAIAVPEVNYSLANQSTEWWSAELAAASLLPVATCILPQESVGRRWIGSAAISVSVAAITLIINGVLSPQLASNYENAFYEMSKTLSIMNLARRFEVIVAALMITGWFVTCALYQSVIAETVDCLVGSKSKILSWLLQITVVGIYLLDGKIRAEIVLIADIVMIATTVICHEKRKIIKNEKRY